MSIGLRSAWTKKTRRHFLMLKKMSCYQFCANPRKNPDAKCESCLEGFKGKDCEQCVNEKKDFKTLCTTCLQEGRIGDNCEICVDEGCCAYPNQNPLNNCLCKDGYTGEGCNTCIQQNRDPLTACGSCIEGYGGPDCDECVNRKKTIESGCKDCYPTFKGQDCEACENDNADLPDCTACKSEYTNAPACDRCFNPRMDFSKACSQCKEQYAGTTCDECSELFSGDTCEECKIENMDPLKSCTQCKANFRGPTCAECKNDKKTTLSKCTECQERFKGTECDQCAYDNAEGTDCTCKPGFRGDKCEACADDTRDIDSLCVNCKSEFKGPNCDECSDPTKDYASQCKKCKSEFKDDGVCKECLNPRMDPNQLCKKCLVTFSGPECKDCSANPRLDPDQNCTVCKAQYDGEDCGACKNSLKDINTECVNCSNSIFGGDKCDQCADARYALPCDGSLCANTEQLTDAPACACINNPYALPPDCSTCLGGQCSRFNTIVALPVAADSSSAMFTVVSTSFVPLFIKTDATSSSWYKLVGKTFKLLFKLDYPVNNNESVIFFDNVMCFASGKSVYYMIDDESTQVNLLYTFDSNVRVMNYCNDISNNDRYHIIVVLQNYGNTFRLPVSHTSRSNSISFSFDRFIRNMYLSTKSICIGNIAYFNSVDDYNKSTIVSYIIGDTVSLNFSITIFGKNNAFPFVFTTFSGILVVGYNNSTNIQQGNNVLEVLDLPYKFYMCADGSLSSSVCGVPGDSWTVLSGQYGGTAQGRVYLFNYDNNVFTHTVLYKLDEAITSIFTTGSVLMISTANNIYINGINNTVKIQYCQNSYTDVFSDAKNCGSCGNECQSNQECRDGFCSIKYACDGNFTGTTCTECVKGFTGAKCDTLDVNSLSILGEVQDVSNASGIKGQWSYVLCPPGYGTNACVKCPANMASFRGGKCTTCRAGFAPSADQSECNACATGLVSNAGDATCSECPSRQDGQFNQCVTCPSGTDYWVVRPPGKRCLACPEGWVAKPGSLQCTYCAYSTIPSEDKTSCVPCPPGSIVKKSGDTFCTPCEGSTVPNRTDQYADACVSCPADQVKKNGVCTNCPLGTAPDLTQTTCQKCPLGYIGTGASCQQCLPANFYTSNEAGTQCIFCTGNTYLQDGKCVECKLPFILRNTLCSPCEAKTVPKLNASTGKYECVACNIGQAASPGDLSCRACTSEDVTAGVCQSACKPGFYKPGGRSCSDCSSDNSISDFQYCDGIYGVADTCPNGMYSDITRTKCIACGQNEFYNPILGVKRCENCSVFGQVLKDGKCVDCPLGSVASIDGSCVKCASNEYSPTRNTCIQCEGNKIVLNNSCVCPKNLPTWNNTTKTCEPCPAGYVLRNGTCESCPSGTYSPSQDVPCEPCPASKPFRYSGFECRECPPGQIYENGDCKLCGYGTFAENGVCKACAPGSTSSFGATSCTLCPAGTKTEGTNNTCYKCAAGTFSATDGSSACARCPAGTYSAEGATECTPCPANTASFGGGSILNCQACGSGYVSQPGSKECTLCPAGTYANGSECSLCPANTFSFSGATTCTACLNSFSFPGSTFCSECFSGQIYSNGRCTDCPAGTYRSSFTECKACPAGQTSAAGSASCVNCVAGQYLLGGECRNCAPGTYSSAVGTPCAPCPANTVSPAGATQCLASCPGGYDSLGNGTCGPCPSGSVKP